MLIHQDRRLEILATVNLCPYSLRMDNYTINESPNLHNSKERSPLQILSNVDVQKNTKHWIPFECPEYMLEAPFQSWRVIYNKQEYRSKVGIYLGRYPNDVRNVALILDRTMGLVYPQFHVTFDPRFCTVKHNNFDLQWQAKARLLINNKERKSTRSPG